MKQHWHRLSLNTFSLDDILSRIATSYDTYIFFYINVIGILGVGKSLDAKPVNLRRPIMSNVDNVDNIISTNLHKIPCEECNTGDDDKTQTHRQPHVLRIQTLSRDRDELTKSLFSDHTSCSKAIITISFMTRERLFSQRSPV